MYTVAVLTAIFQQLTGTRMSPFWILLELMVMGGGGDNWSYKTCKAPVKMSPATNQHSVFTGRMPFLSPNQQCQITEESWVYIKYILSILSLYPF